MCLLPVSLIPGVKLFFECLDLLLLHPAADANLDEKDDREAVEEGHSKVRIEDPIEQQCNEKRCADGEDQWSCTYRCPVSSSSRYAFFGFRLKLHVKEGQVYQCFLLSLASESSGESISITRSL